MAGGKCCYFQCTLICEMDLHWSAKKEGQSGSGLSHTINVQGSRFMCAELRHAYMDVYDVISP